MSRFRVGQRVLLARPLQPQNAGKTGIVREIWSDEQESAIDGEMLDCSIDWDNGDRDAGEWDFDDYRDATHTDQLEPILDQHQPCEDDFKRDLDRMLEKEEVR